MLAQSLRGGYAAQRARGTHPGGPNGRKTPAKSRHYSGEPPSNQGTIQEHCHRDPCGVLLHAAAGEFTSFQSPNASGTRAEMEGAAGQAPAQVRGKSQEPRANNPESGLHAGERPNQVSSLAASGTRMRKAFAGTRPGQVVQITIRAGQGSPSACIRRKVSWSLRRRGRWVVALITTHRIRWPVHQVQSTTACVGKGALGVSA